MQKPDPVSVFTTLATAINNGDLIDATSFFTDNASVKLSTPLPGLNNTYSGREQVKGGLQQLIADHDQITLGLVQAITNEADFSATVTSDRVRQMGMNSAELSFHAVLNGAQIQSLDVSLSPQTAQKVQSAIGAMQR
jgi:hypothetical protein